MVFDNQKWANFDANYKRSTQKEKTDVFGSVDDLIAKTHNTQKLDLDKFIPPLDGTSLDPQSA